MIWVQALACCGNCSSLAIDGSARVRWVNAWTRPDEEESCRAERKVVENKRRGRVRGRGAKSVCLRFPPPHHSRVKRAQAPVDALGHTVTILLLATSFAFVSSWSSKEIA